MAGGFDIGKLFGRIELEDMFSSAIELVGHRIDKVDQKLGGFGKHVAETATGFLTAQAAASAFSKALDVTTDFITDLAIRGSEVDSVVENFEHLTTSAGRLGDTLLNELREGTKNTIDDLTLIKMVNQDLAAGMDLTDQQFRTLADGAFALAQATGTDVKTALDTMNDAMLTGRTRALQLLTGKIDLTKAEESYAKSLGTTRDHLTEEGKLMAARKAILESVGAATQRLGEQTVGLGEMIEQAQTFWRNFQDDLGRSLATSPVIIEGLKAIGEELAAAFGGDQQDIIKTVTTLIEDAALSTLDFAQTVSDAVGLAGRTWNSFKLIIAEVAQGYRALTIMVEEALLVLAKGGDLLGLDIAHDAVVSLEADLDRLYTALAETSAAQDDYKRSQDEWAQSTGRVNEAIERIRARMLEAREATRANTDATESNTEAQQASAAAANGVATAQEKAGQVMAITAEEAKKLAAAQAELASVGKDYKETIAGINAETVKAIKNYMEMGVAQGTLATAYKLSTSQVAAIAKEFQEEQKALEKSKKAAQDKAKAIAELNGLSEDYEKTLRTMNRGTREQAAEFLKAGASAETVQKALGLTEAQMAALQKAAAAATVKTDALGASLGDKVAREADKASQMIRTLSGELLTMQEYQEKQNGPTSYSIHRGNLRNNLAWWGIPEGLAFELAEKGFSFQEIRDAWLSKTWKTWKPHGPRIPGFAEGGIGNFGTGTLAMLHGREAIIPLDKAGGMMAPKMYFYVNGTAEESARKIGSIIMRQLKNTRQLGAA